MSNGSDLSFAGLKANAEYYKNLYVKFLKEAQRACELHTIAFRGQISAEKALERRG